MRFFGYYLAEGCLSKDRVIFTFNIRESEYIQDTATLCKQYFKLNAKIHQNDTKHTSVIYIHSKSLSIFMDSVFGHYAKEKIIPEWCLYLPQSFLVEFFTGWARGDGGFKKDCFAVTTISRDIAFKMKLILMKLGIIPYVNSDKTRTGNNAYHLMIAGRQLQELQKKTGICHPVNNRGIKINKYSYFDGQKVWYSVRSIDQSDYTGPVCSIKTGSNSALVANFAVMSGL
jgi:hypothetical protein